MYNPLANALHAPWKLAAIAARQAGAHRRSRSPAIVPRRKASAPLRILDLAAGDALDELRHVEVRMAMPAPDPDDPRWSLKLAGGALIVNGSGLLRITRDSHDEPPDGDPPGGLCCPCVAALSGRRRMI